MTRFTGSRVLITGGSRGIGAATARRLAAEGAAVVLTYRSEQAAARELVAELRGTGATAHAVGGDVGDPAQAEAVVQAAAEHLGGLDVLVSNAGVEHFGALEEITAEDFDRVYAVNVRGQLLVTKHAVQHMGPGARIVLMSSVSAHKSVYRHALYASSKAAVESLVRQLALELGDRGIAINAIAPGGTETDMAAEVTPNYAPHRYELAPEDALRGMCALGRMARPEEIAAAVAFLASSDASYVTGRALAADGGFV